MNDWCIGPGCSDSQAAGSMPHKSLHRTLHTEYDTEGMPQEYNYVCFKATTYLLAALYIGPLPSVAIMLYVYCATACEPDKGIMKAATEKNDASKSKQSISYFKLASMCT